jgi:hypothetical protein
MKDREMIRKFTDAAERLACGAGVSRRGFLGWLGGAAAGIVAVICGRLASTADAAPPGCTSNSDCRNDGMYCARRACRGPGKCEPRPDFCTEIYDPVCGCDGQTYPNACYAARAGANVQHPGPCRQAAY